MQPYIVAQQQLQPTAIVQCRSTLVMASKLSLYHCSKSDSGVFLGTDMSAITSMPASAVIRKSAVLRCPRTFYPPATLESSSCQSSGWLARYTAQESTQPSNVRMVACCMNNWAHTTLMQTYCVYQVVRYAVAYCQSHSSTCAHVASLILPQTPLPCSGNCEPRMH